MRASDVLITAASLAGIFKNGNVRSGSRFGNIGFSAGELVY